MPTLDQGLQALNRKPEANISWTNRPSFCLVAFQPDQLQDAGCLLCPGAFQSRHRIQSNHIGLPPVPWSATVASGGLLSCHLTHWPDHTMLQERPESIWIQWSTIEPHPTHIICMCSSLSALKEAMLPVRFGSCELCLIHRIYYFHVSCWHTRHDDLSGRGGGAVIAHLMHKSIYLRGGIQCDQFTVTVLYHIEHINTWPHTLAELCWFEAPTLIWNFSMTATSAAWKKGNNKNMVFLLKESVNGFTFLSTFTWK